MLQPGPSLVPEIEKVLFSIKKLKKNVLREYSFKRGNQHCGADLLFGWIILVDP